MKESEYKRLLKRIAQELAIEIAKSNISKDLKKSCLSLVNSAFLSLVHEGCNENSAFRGRNWGCKDKCKEENGCLGGDRETVICLRRTFRKVMDWEKKDEFRDRSRGQKRIAPTLRHETQHITESTKDPEWLQSVVQHDTIQKIKRICKNAEELERLMRSMIAVLLDDKLDEEFYKNANRGENYFKKRVFQQLRDKHSLVTTQSLNRAWDQLKHKARQFLPKE